MWSSLALLVDLRHELSNRYVFPVAVMIQLDWGGDRCGPLLSGSLRRHCLYARQTLQKHSFRYVGRTVGSPATGSSMHKYVHSVRYFVYLLGFSELYEKKRFSFVEFCYLLLPSSSATARTKRHLFFFFEMRLASDCAQKNFFSHGLPDFDEHGTPKNILSNCTIFHLQADHFRGRFLCDFVQWFRVGEFSAAFLLGVSELSLSFLWSFYATIFAFFLKKHGSAEHIIWYMFFLFGSLWRAPLAGPAVF